MAKDKKKKDPRDWTTKDSLEWYSKKIFGQGLAGEAAKNLKERGKQTDETVRKMVKGDKKKGG